MSKSSNESDGTRNLSRTAERFTVWVVALLLSLTPLSNPDLWWQMVRGRTVLSGEVQPSQFLLISEQLPNSDWLNGAIPWLAYSNGGIPGLMLLKIGLSLFVVWRLTRAGNASPRAVLYSVIVLVAIHSAFNPSAVSVDLVGILLAASLAKHQRFLWLGILAAVWANFSVGALWVVPTYLCFANEKQSLSFRQTLTWLALLFLCLSLTPRGLSSVNDMVVFFAPWLFSEFVFLRDTAYASCQITLPVVAGLILALSIVVSSNFNASQKFAVAGAVLCGLLAVRHFPPAATLCGVMLLDRLNGQKVERTPSTAIRMGHLGLIVVLLIGCVSGGLDGQGERLGWGVANAIDIRYAERDLHYHQQTEIRAHCTDISGAGMLLFALPNAKVVDVSEAAIRSGRLRSYSLLNHDLATGRKAAFTRQDGSEGGWWRALINADICLLVVPPRREAILTSLEPTLWKPLSLDAPELIFATAGRQQFSSQILQARDERDLVELGPWRHQPLYQTELPSHTDLWASIAGAPDNRADLRQAQAFRAMQMPTGAVRTLLPVLQGIGRPSATSDFVKAQQFLAWQEWLNCGHVSTLRCQTLEQLCGTVSVAGVPEADLLPNAASLIPADAIRLYCSGDALSAAALVTSQTPEALYARLCLQWEAGSDEDSGFVLKEMETHFPDHPLTAMSRLLHDVE